MKALKRFAIGFALFIVAHAVAAFMVRRLVPEFGDETDDEVSIVASMGGREFISASDGLRSIGVLAFMGGVELDLSNAQIVDGALVTIRAFMGGVDLIVPDGWRVEVSNTVFMGGVDNRTNPDFVGESAPLLIVDTMAVMGGVDIHVAETE
jgi:hypothetical protein